jgi:uncharacterized protein (DUF2267 family)
MSTGLAVFDTTINETNTWLKALQDEIYCDRHQAYAGMRAVFHALRDRLSPGGAMRLAAQLPLLLRGVYVEGWRLEDTPIRTHTAAAFIERVAAALPPKFDLDPGELTRATLLVMWRQMQGGALEKARDEVPEDIRSLWPDPALIA